MKSIQQSIHFHEKNKIDEILVEFIFSYVAICSGSHPSTLLVFYALLFHVCFFKNNAYLTLFKNYLCVAVVQSRLNQHLTVIAIM